jgi:hypothetical protein
MTEQLGNGLNHKERVAEFSSGFSISAIALAFSGAALVSYPSAAVFVEKGQAPHTGAWFIFTIVLGGLLATFSLMPRGKLLVENNFLVLPLFGFMFYWMCYFFSPDSVGDNTLQLLGLSIFSAGAPLWIPGVALIAHTRSCFAMTLNEPVV